MVLWVKVLANKLDDLSSDLWDATGRKKTNSYKIYPDPHTHSCMCTHIYMHVHT